MRLAKSRSEASPALTVETAPRDGVDEGSTLGIAMFVEEQSILEQALLLHSKNTALTEVEAYELAEAAVKMKSEIRERISETSRRCANL